MTAGGSGAAGRLRWLFEVVAAPEQGGRWRRYTDAELVEFLASTLRIPNQSARAVLSGIRAGAPARPETLEAIARFFQVRPEFFDDEAETVEVVQEAVVARQLRACGCWPYLVCRMSLPRAERIGQLRAALLRLRPLSSCRPNDGLQWQDGHDMPENDPGTAMMAPTPMSAAQLQGLCRGLVHELGLRPPWEPEELCRRLGERRGRRIKVRAVDLGATTGVGHLAPTGTVERIFVEQDAPLAQRALVICHEVVHLVRGHLDLDAGDSLTCGLDEDGSADWREWEAEVGGRALVALSRRRPLPNRLVGAGPAEHSIAAAFGFSEGS